MYLYIIIFICDNVVVIQLFVVRTIPFYISGHCKNCHTFWRLSQCHSYSLLQKLSQLCGQHYCIYSGQHVIVKVLSSAFYGQHNKYYCFLVVIVRVPETHCGQHNTIYSCKFGVKKLSISFHQSAFDNKLAALQDDICIYTSQYLQALESTNIISNCLHNILSIPLIDIVLHITSFGVKNNNRLCRALCCTTRSEQRFYFFFIFLFLS